VGSTQDVFTITIAAHIASPCGFNTRRLYYHNCCSFSQPKRMDNWAFMLKRLSRLQPVSCVVICVAQQLLTCVRCLIGWHSDLRTLSSLLFTILCTYFDNIVCILFHVSFSILHSLLTFRSGHEILRVPRLLILLLLLLSFVVISILFAFRYPAYI